MSTRAGRLTLRDIDNRDGDVPYEFTGSRKQVIGYLEGPLRSDLREGEGQTRGGEAIRLAAEAIQHGDLATANEHLKWLGVQVRLP